MRNRVALALAVLPIVAACTDSTGPSGARQVAVRFDAVTTTSGSASLASPANLALSGALLDHVAATGPITVTGDNGTLLVQDIRVIISELELKRADAQCVGEEDGDACEEFEGGPYLVNLLDGSASALVNTSIPAGSYTQFEWKVEDLDADEDDDSAERQAMQAVLAQMRQAYPAFPSGASMVVHGTFTPTGGTAQPFTVYFDAEIEVEQEFAAPFRVPEDGDITVHLEPARWFLIGTQVIDPRLLDGRTIEFHSQFRSGVLEVDHDGD